MSQTRAVYTGRIITVTLEEAVLPSGKRVELEMIRHPGAAAIVALDDGDCVSLVHQFRHATGGFIWEIPAGTLGRSEAPEACARRELQEEAGLVAQQWTPLGHIFTAPGFCDERIHLFLARQLSPAPAQLDADEELTPARVPLREALAMVRRGDICDAKSIAGLHRAAIELGRIS
ncbi:MAG: NUDIX hydrolase [Candidatus Binatia bacterium]